MFDVNFLVNTVYELTLPMFLFRSDENRQPDLWDDLWKIY
jgi:hypothetical protein